MIRSYPGLASTIYWPGRGEVDYLQGCAVDPHSYELVPVTLKQAAAFVRRVHSHLPAAPVGWKFGIGLQATTVDLDDAPGWTQLVGVVMAGRPVSRVLASDPRVLEVSRVALVGGTNTASRLLGAAARAARAMGYRQLVTYTLQDEPGTSLRAAGFVQVAQVPARRRGWSDGDTAGLAAKIRWGRQL